MTTQDLADAYNARIAAGSRAGEIEWYVTSRGDLALRFCREWSEHRTEQIARATRAEQREWARRAAGRLQVDGNDGVR